MIRSRRFALIAAISALTLAGCGDSNSTSNGTPPVIRIGAAATGGLATAAESDKMMVPYFLYDFVYDGALPDLGDSAAAWSLPLGGPADRATVERLAATLGVEGEPRELGADMGGGWMVGAEDYSTANLTVSADGMLSWWYNPDPSVWGNGTSWVCAEPGVAVDPAVSETSSVDPGTETPAAPPDTTDATGITTVPECVEPTPPEGVPSEAEAEASARALMAELGIDASQYSFETYADDWSASVTGFMMLGGARTSLAVSFGFGAEGALTWASGFLATPQSVGEYPLVDTAAGLERLGQDQWMGFYGAAMARGGVAMDAVSSGPVSEVVVGNAGATSSGAPDSTEVAPTEPVETVVVETVPVDTAVPVTEPIVISPPDSVPTETITVTLTDVRLDLTMVWDVDGAVWLVPAYTFVSADQGEFTVLAVEDGYVELPDPGLTPEPMPVDMAVPGDGGGTDGGSGTGEITPLPDPIEIDAAAAVVVGLTEDEAAVAAEKNGWGFRVAVRDGEYLPLTADYSPTRVNVAVEAGVVTAVESIG